MKRVVEFLFCLPGTNAVVERIFSFVSNYWSDEKSSLSPDMLEAAMFLKCNIGLSCRDFAERIKNEQKLLQEVHSSEKKSNR